MINYSFNFIISYHFFVFSIMSLGSVKINLSGLIREIPNLPRCYSLYMIHPQLLLIVFFLLLVPSFSISIHPSLLLISIYFCIDSYHFSFNSSSSFSFYTFHLSSFYRFIFYLFLFQFLYVIFFLCIPLLFFVISIFFFLFFLQISSFFYI